MPDTNIPGHKWSTDEILNFTAVDVDGDGKPDANGVCNPDGSPVGASARLIDDCEDYTQYSAVAASAADTIAASTTHRIGTKSVSFAKNGTAVIAAIQKSWPVAINYGVEEAAREAIQWSMYLPTVVGVTNVFIRLGKDATNYAQATIPVASLTGAQWNRISVQFLDDTKWTQNGTGFDTADLRYVAVGITTALAATAIAGILVDNILSIDYVETNLRASVTMTSTGQTKIEGGVGGALLDVTADGAQNAAFVQSNSLAKESGGNLATLAGVSFSTSTKQSDGTQKTQLVDGAGNVVGAATGNALDVRIKSDGASLATSAKQDTGNNSLSSIDGKLGTLGQKAMAGSAPVVVASDQTPVPFRGDVVVLGNYASTAGWNLVGGATNIALRDSEGIRRTNNIKFDGVGTGAYCGIEQTITATGVPTSARNVHLRVIFSGAKASYTNLLIKVRAGGLEREFNVANTNFRDYWNVIYIPWEDPTFAGSVSNLSGETALTRVYFLVNDSGGTTYIVNEVSIGSSYEPLADKYGNPITSKEEGVDIRSLDVNVRSGSMTATVTGVATASNQTGGSQKSQLVDAAGNSATTRDTGGTTRSVETTGRPDMNTIATYRYAKSASAIAENTVARAAPGAGYAIAILSVRASAWAAQDYTLETEDDVEIMQFPLAANCHFTPSGSAEAPLDILPENKALHVMSANAVNHDLYITTILVAV